MLTLAFSCLSTSHRFDLLVIHLSLYPSTLLAQGHHGILLKCIDVLLFKLSVNLSNLFHRLVRLRLKLLVIEIYQLVAEAVDVPTEASLPWNYIVVVVYIFVQERPVS